MNRKEKGSIMLVMILMLMLMSIATILTLLFVSEKINFERSTHKALVDIYEEDKKYEITKNMVKQQFSQLSYENIDDIIWSSDNSAQVERLLSDNIFPKLLGKYEAFVETTNDSYVSEYCEELSREIDGEIEFIGFECNNENIEIGFKIRVLNEKEEESIFEFNVTGITIDVVGDGSTLSLNLYDINIETVNLEG